MRQDTFDSLVTVRAMVDVTGDERIFNDVIRRYRMMYPDENAHDLIIDVNVAAVTAWKITKLIVQMPLPQTDKDKTKFLLSVLNQLRNIMKENAQQSDEFPKDSLFNSRPTPTADRVANCRKHLALAGEQLVLNHIGMARSQ
jgi:hypothetical protein